MTTLSIGSANDFIGRATFDLSDGDACRPVALLLGSGVSAGAVPGVNQIIGTVRAALGSDFAPDFDKELARLESPGEKYQAAFQYLSRFRPPSFRDRIIRAAVLGAYPLARDSKTVPSPGNLFEFENDANAWTIPPGTQALGRIFTGLQPVKRGPIITTNFDPLVEIAIRRSGGSAITTPAFQDAPFSHTLSMSHATNVIHVHGFWREGQTLSLTTQLTQARPALLASLREILRTHTVWVIGYSGWRDCIMIALESIVKEQGNPDLDLVWCGFPNKEAFSRELENSESLKSLYQSGNCQFYAGCDSNSILPEVEKRISPTLDYPAVERRSLAAAGLMGWEMVGTARIVAQEDARSRALDVLDGREVRLEDGFNSLLPRRDVVGTIVNQLRADEAQGASLTLLVGPSGEGKSLALVQIASELATRFPDASIALNVNGDIINAQDITRIPPKNVTFLLIDEGHRALQSLRELSKELNDNKRRHIHFVVAARDTDWGSDGGSTFAWGNYLHYRRHIIKGLSHVDAESIVAACENLGTKALGELTNYATHEQRVEQLLYAASDKGLNLEGTLFGATLRVRFGEGLQEHLRQLTLRLADRQIEVPGEKSPGSLLDALVMISLPHSVRIPDLNYRLLAKALDLNEFQLSAFVLGPLCEEVPISAKETSVTTRHRSIARGILRAVRDDIQVTGADPIIHRCIDKLVEAAVLEIDNVGLTQSLMRFAYLSKELEAEDERLAAARASVRASPKRLSYRSRLSAELRAQGDAEEALSVIKESLSISWQSPDRLSGVRQVLNELGVTHGSLGRHEMNVYFCALALSDLPSANSLELNQLEFPLSCLADGCCHAWERTRRYAFAQGAAGVVGIADSVPGIDINPQWVARYRNVAGRAGAPIPSSIDDCWIYIGAAAMRAKDSMGEVREYAFSGFSFDDAVRITQLHRERL